VCMITEEDMEEVESYRAPVGFLDGAIHIPWN